MSTMKSSTIQIIMLKSKLGVNRVRIHNNEGKKKCKKLLGCKTQRNYVTGRLSNVGVNKI
jgi:hypothetical protein